MSISFNDFKPYEDSEPDPYKEEKPKGPFKVIHRGGDAEDLNEARGRVERLSMSRDQYQREAAEYEEREKYAHTATAAERVQSRIAKPEQARTPGEAKTKVLENMDPGEVRALITAAQQVLEQKETKEFIKGLFKDPASYVTDPVRREYIFIISEKGSEMGVVLLPFDKKRELFQNPAFKVQIEYLSRDYVFDLLEDIKITLARTLLQPIEHLQTLITSEFDQEEEPVSQLEQDTEERVEDSEGAPESLYEEEDYNDVQ